MKYKVQSNSFLADGTSLQGHIRADYQELVDLFGEPLDGDGYKTDAEWIIEFSDGVLATIYNWKNGRNYCGHEAPPVEAITEWNIGGKSKTAADHVHVTVKLYVAKKIGDNKPLEDKSASEILALIYEKIDSKSYFDGSSTFNWAYAYGYLQSTMRFALEEMNLTDEQLRILESKILE